MAFALGRKLAGLRRLSEGLQAISAEATETADHVANESQRMLNDQEETRAKFDAGLSSLLQEVEDTSNATNAMIGESVRMLQAGFVDLPRFLADLGSAEGKLRSMREMILNDFSQDAVRNNIQNIIKMMQDAQNSAEGMTRAVEHLRSAGPDLAQYADQIDRVLESGKGFDEMIGALEELERRSNGPGAALIREIIQGLQRDRGSRQRRGRENNDGQGRRNRP